MDFGNLIAGLLQTHDCVIVPSLGGFLAQRKGACRNENDCLIPPQRVFSFNARLTGNDGLLIHAAVSSSGLSYEEVSNRLKKFVSAARALLAAREKVFIDGVGELSVDEEGNIQFNPIDNQSAFNGSFGLRTIQAKPVKKEKDTELEKVVVRQTKSKQPTLSFRRSKRVKFIRSFARYAALAMILFLVGGVGAIFYLIDSQNSTSVNQASLSPVADTFGNTQAKLDSEIAQQNLSDESDKLTAETEREELSVALVTPESNLPSGYYVIVGAFAKESNADAMFNRLRDDFGGDVPVIKKERNGLIAVGFFASEKHKAAVEVLRNAQAMEEKAWLLRL